MAKLLLLDGHSLAYRAFFALPTDLATKDGHRHQRGLRLHVDAHEGDRRRAARPPRGRVRRAGRQHVPQRARPRVQGGPQGDARPLPVAAAAHPRGARGARDHAARDAGRRGRRRDRHARDAGRGRRASTSSSSPATATRTSSCTIRTSRCSTTSAASPTTCSTTKPGIAERCRGVTPAQYLDYAALRGDTSDNLPGVPGHRREDRGEADHHLRRPRRHLRAPRRAAAEAAPEPRRSARTACSRTARCRVLDRDVDVDGRADGPRARARSTASRCACCSTSSSSARCCRASSTRSATSARRRAPKSATLEVEVAIARDADGRASALLAGSPNTATRVAIEARWAGAAGRSRSAALAVATGADAATYVDADLLDDADGARARSRRWSTPASPPLVAHRAKELMHGLARRPALARARHRADGVPARSRRGEVHARGPRAAVPRRSS